MQAAGHGAVDGLTALRERLRGGDAVVAGVLSGTSADGIDVGLVRFGAAREGLGPPELLAFATHPFPGDLGPRVRAVLDGAPLALGELARLDRDLGTAFGRAARAQGDAAGRRLDLVASHGQTVWHHDGAPPELRATLQLGDGCHVARAAGCAVASDFRQADVAAGGEGAPLSALADDALFAGAPRPLVVLNLGGISNLTVLARDGGVLALDAGPCGSLLDGLARRLLGLPFDPDGRTAAAGRARAERLGAWLDHPFFVAPPPKSTGRDTFGAAFVEAFRSREADLGPEDLLATATELVAECVALALRSHAPSVGGSLVLCGGGARNAALVGALRRRTGLPTLSSAALGVDPDAREALVFAVLGARAALGLPSTLEGATGAERGRVLGKLSPGAPLGGAP